VSFYGHVQPEGSSTARKEQGFAACMGMSLDASMPLPHEIFWYLSCNAGTGLNKTCEGDPLVFARQALRRRRRHVRMELCDSHPEAIEQLRANIERTKPWLEDWQAAFYPCDNREFLPRVAEKIRRTERHPECAFGLVVCDPVSQGNGYPRLALREFAWEFRKMDLLIHVNVAAQAMVEGAIKAGQKGFEQWLRPEELMAEFPPKTWWVRNPSRGGAGIQRFITLYGHGWERGKRTRFADFYPVDSVYGQKILKCYAGFEDGENLLPFGYESISEEDEG
jgi:hypothetical protein